MVIFVLNFKYSKIVKDSFAIQFSIQTWLTLLKFFLVNFPNSRNERFLMNRKDKEEGWKELSKEGLTQFKTILSAIERYLRT